MTTPPQPGGQNSRSRKRPAPGTSAPVVSSLPATAGSAATAADMGYYNSVPTGTTGGPPGSIYVSDGAPMSVPTTSQPDMYRQQPAQGPQPGLYAPTGPDTQLTRVPRANQLIRMPSFNGMNPPGIPQSLVSGNQLPINLNMMQGMMGQSGAFDQVTGMDATDRDLFSRIEKMKKKRANIPPFVLKLSSFVNDPKTDHLIRWAPSGNSFMVLDEDEFSKTLIPDLFKHNNYASFVRQLNMYGFHKVVGLADGSLKTSEQRSKPPSEYENPYFKRGQPDLMWLIQKPKSKNTRGKGKKGVKQEEQDTDREDNGSDAGGGDGDVGAYIEGPKDSHDGHHGGAKSQRFDFQAIVNQIEAIRNHQAMISAAINRLRKDHQQLYEQSLAFQSLHDRHENSINAILTFLATVYDKSLGGHINGAVNNLFSHQVDQGIHRAGAGTATGPNPNGAIIPTTPTLRNNALRTPQMNRRKPLLLEGAPSFTGDVQNVPANGHAARNSPAANGGAGQPNFQQNLNIQELFNNPGSNGSSPSDSPQQQPTVNGSSNVGGFTPITRIPDSPIPTSAPPRYTTTPGAAIPVTASNTAVPTPRSIAKALGQPFASNTQALQDHNNSLAQKSREMEELEQLQSRQNDNIDQLMGLMRDYSDNADVPINGDGGVSDVDQFFDFGLQGDGFVTSDGLALDGHSVDIDELLRGVDENGNQNDTKGHILGTDPSTVATSPTGSSVGGRAREELEEEIEEVQPKRRRVA